MGTSNTRWPIPTIAGECHEARRRRHARRHARGQSQFKPMMPMVFRVLIFFKSQIENRSDPIRGFDR
jgi:hypothetical protein